MIYGIGHDVLEIKRVNLLLSGTHGQKFMERVLTESERQLAEDRSGRKAEFTAGRFAAKEALSKAFGCGIGANIGFLDMEVLPDRLGRPVAAISGAAWSRLGIADPENYLIHLSISHQSELASAFAVIERKGD
ncbi:holo-ACP synthase [Paenibacillus lemnae]|uniref:Holo-[acyl-carrier-protein] synthase n=1 Tax=Paenibacillus lemnae TaxID=1330551 RepID=A0A848MBE5_PAELE|nr:holo-ACP synthase [Paenibacillus lemnae]NMO97382.1 holo-ACP synthase [Paenibacillus lemnae]